MIGITALTLRAETACKPNSTGSASNTDRPSAGGCVVPAASGGRGDRPATNRPKGGRALRACNHGGGYAVLPSLGEDCTRIAPASGWKRADKTDLQGGGGFEVGQATGRVGGAGGRGRG